MITAERTPVQTDRPPKLRQVPGLDGLRAIAVVAVIVFHLNPHWLPGGFLGVDVFFVISGYLITSLILDEHRRRSTVSLGRFWARRARRLLPALAFVLFAVTVTAALVARDALSQLQSDIPAAIVYLLNWRLLLSHDSYVASFGRPPLLQHLWSLSVEEQFYLLWPPVLLILRRRMTRGRIAWVALAGAAVSAGLMAGLFHPGGNPSAVYFGSDTHAEGLLIGCALAAAVPPWRMTASVTPTARRVLERSGLLALGVVIGGLAVLEFDSTLTYRGGIVIVDVATAVVVATVAHPASRLGAGLARQPLRWLGLRSYSLYLWHWPIFMMTRPGSDLRWGTGPDVILRLGLTAAAAELTYRYIEQPWRDGRALFAWRLRLASIPRPQLVMAAGVPVALVAVLLATAPGPAEPAILAEGSTVAARSPLSLPPRSGAVSDRPAATNTVAPNAIGQDRPGGFAPPTAAKAVTATTIATTSGTVATTTPTNRPVPPAADAPQIESINPADEPILAVGDSVLLAASPTITATFGAAVTVDAQIGRQVSGGLTRLAAYRKIGALAHFKTVVIDFGTNGAFTAAEFDQMSFLLAGVPHVVVFNVHVARSWAAVSNATVVQGVAAHPAQMRLADWNGAATPSLLYPDGIHPDPAGAAAYTRLIETALASRP